MTKKTITKDELENAQRVIVTWFFEQNQNQTQKPITVLDTEIELHDGTQRFRLFNFLTFYGRDEAPTIIYDEVKE